MSRSTWCTAPATCRAAPRTGFSTWSLHMAGCSRRTRRPCSSRNSASTTRRSLLSSSSTRSSSPPTAASKHSKSCSWPVMTRQGSAPRCARCWSRRQDTPLPTSPASCWPRMPQARRRSSMTSSPSDSTSSSGTGSPASTSTPARPQRSMTSSCGRSAALSRTSPPIPRASTATSGSTSTACATTYAAKT